MFYLMEKHGLTRTMVKYRLKVAKEKTTSDILLPLSRNSAFFSFLCRPYHFKYAFMYNSYIFTNDSRDTVNNTSNSKRCIELGLS